VHAGFVGNEVAERALRFRVDERNDVGESFLPGRRRPGASPPPPEEAVVHLLKGRLKTA
jgi:hypothetical protein